jgi:hypothetical protein
MDLDIGKIITFILIALYYIVPAIRGKKNKAEKRNSREIDFPSPENRPVEKRKAPKTEQDFEKKLKELFGETFQRTEKPIEKKTATQAEEKPLMFHQNPRVVSKGSNAVDHSSSEFEERQKVITEVKSVEEENDFWDEFGDFDARKMIIYNEILNKPKWQ